MIRFVESCDCQRNKSSNQKPAGLLKLLDPPQIKWTHATMDFVTPLSKCTNGNTAIFVVGDRLSKMIRSIPMKPNQDAPKVAKLYKDSVYRHHGLPLNNISDRDPIFMSKFWKALFETFGTRLSPSSAYHLQTDEQAEIMNRKIEDMIRCFVIYDKSNSDVNLVDFEVAYNSSVQARTTFTLSTSTMVLNQRQFPYKLYTLIVLPRAIKVAQAEIRRTNETTAAASIGKDLRRSTLLET